MLMSSFPKQMFWCFNSKLQTQIMFGGLTIRCRQNSLHQIKFLKILQSIQLKDASLTNTLTVGILCVLTEEMMCQHQRANVCRVN